MKLPMFHLDAFTGTVFGGNPAVVICVEEWLPDALLAAIAVEHNISTTAFLRKDGDAYEIRYFMPIGELSLVGHASLAAAHVLLRLLRPDLASTTLRRRGGALHVSKLDNGSSAITLPASPAQPCSAPAGLRAALGVPIAEVRANDAQYFAVLDSQSAVARTTPDMDALMQLDRDGVIVTAPGDDCDFVSRAFAPKEGLPEDPVCGSAHLALVPYWSERLVRTEHRALQLSPRGGELHCALTGGEVRLAGRCALYMEGAITI
ncbi:MAG: PhzF family phenazine biosynthesis protein [Dongiaceae bacterium]